MFLGVGWIGGSDLWKTRVSATKNARFGCFVVRMLDGAPGRVVRGPVRSGAWPMVFSGPHQVLPLCGRRQVQYARKRCRTRSLSLYHVSGVLSTPGGMYLAGFSKKIGRPAPRGAGRAGRSRSGRARAIALDPALDQVVVEHPAVQDAELLAGHEAGRPDRQAEKGAHLVQGSPPGSFDVAELVYQIDCFVASSSQ